MDDEDDFLYGTPTPPAESDTAVATEPAVEADLDLSELGEPAAQSSIDVPPAESAIVVDAPANNGEEDEDEEEEEDESDSDVEIILHTSLPARSLDFRPGHPGPRKSLSQSQSSTSRPLDLTTEYTVRDRNAPLHAPVLPPLHPPPPSLSPALPQAAGEVLARATPSIGPPLTTSSTVTPTANAPQNGPETAISSVDPSTLPVARASASAPKINPDEPGSFEGMSIFDIDIHNLAEKNWRKPGSDISDWFNYGFDEISWEAYCVRRREVAEMAASLKADVLNMAGMPEEMLNAVPPEMRSMLVAQSVRMGLPQPQQPMPHQGFPDDGSGAYGMGPGGPMMYQGVNGMGVPPEMMGMGFPPQQQQQQHQQHQQPQHHPQHPMGHMQSLPMVVDSPNPEGGMQLHQAQARPAVESPAVGEMNGSLPGSPAPQVKIPDGPRNPGPVQPNQAEGAPANQPGLGEPSNPRGHQGLAVRGAFRGGPMGRGGAIRPIPSGPAAGRGKRAVSPLPANVPTGPRNARSTYKDRDGGTTQADSLDYGGGPSVTDNNNDERDTRDHDSGPGSDRSKTERERRGDRDRDKAAASREKENGEKSMERDERPTRRDKSPPTGPRKERVGKDDRNARKRTHEGLDDERERRSKRR